MKVLKEIPTKCCNCPFFYYTYDENDCYVCKCEALNDKTIDGFVDKYDGCPLKEVSK